MKKILLSKLLIIGGLLMIFNQSCTDLEEDIYSEVLTDNFYQSDEEFTAALGAAYTSLYGYLGTVGPIAAQEVSSDELMVPTRGQDWDDGGHWRRVHLHQWTSEDPVISVPWDFCYGGISTCNRLIFTLESSSQPGGEAFIAELEALRAFFYWLLLDYYGNVPIVTEFDVPADFAPATSSRQDVFNFVESELLRTAPLLSTNVDISTYAKMNYYVAQAILAKLYLNAEVYTGNARWSDALAACDELVNSGKYGLTGNYYDNFNPNNGNSPEAVFAIPYDRVNAKGFNIVQQTLHYASQGTYQLQAQPWNGWCSLEDFYNSYEDDDVRKSNFIVGPQFNLDGSPAIDGGVEDNDPDGGQLNFTPEINELGPNCLRQAGARVGKFAYEVGQNPDMNNDFPIFRYADILLMKAEAMWRMNNGSADALALVNQVRNRAGVDPFASLTEDDLLAERGREMFFEAHRRTDLIRFGKFNDEWFGKTADASQAPDPGRFDPEVRIFPIPKGQLDANPNLVQNPGY